MTQCLFSQSTSLEFFSYCDIALNCSRPGIQWTALSLDLPWKSHPRINDVSSPD